MVSHPQASRTKLLYGLTMRTSLPLLFALALAGCPDNTTPPASDSGVDAHAHDETDAPVGGGPSCESIIAVCHDVDIGTGRIAECHDTAHDAASTEATCAAIVEECVALCTAVDAGPPSDQDAGPHMHMH
jgi:hypothetical protein